LGLTDKTIFCTDGQQTVNAFREELLHSDTDKPVTLILTDLQMPQKNGLKVASEIRELIYRFSTRQERHI
jgi:CheY-like chemotaxis protein